MMIPIFLVKQEARSSIECKGIGKTSRELEDHLLTKLIKISGN